MTKQSFFNPKYYLLIPFISMALATIPSCRTNQAKAPGMDGTEVRLITLAPGHFHAALVQKTAYPQVSATVYVYAPPGDEVQEHLKRIAAYNARPDEPTQWQEVVYTGADYLEQMLSAKKGNLLVLAGNNRQKTEYIEKGIANGLHILADKPMAITTEGFNRLESCFTEAARNGALLYDIMTERHEITNILQRELAHLPAIYGEQLPGSPESPGVEMESVHHFLKTVSGSPLLRPAWFFDEEQQGAAIVDVGVHLVDLVQWELFPGQALDYHSDVELVDADGWDTPLSLAQFKEVTGLDAFPGWLQKNVQDGVLHVDANGSALFKLKGVYAKVSALWKYTFPEGGGDTHYAVMRGSKAHLAIRQGPEQHYVPTLYIRYAGGGSPKDYEEGLLKAFAGLEPAYPGISLRKHEEGEWEVVIPPSYHNGHEAHFGQVTANFLSYLEEGALPAWEIPSMLSKYYITTHALELAHGKRVQP